jgi:hypothetical protein
MEDAKGAKLNKGASAIQALVGYYGTDAVKNPSIYDEFPLGPGRVFFVEYTAQDGSKFRNYVYIDNKKTCKILINSRALVEFIANLDKLSPPPLNYDLFLSYASADTATATELKVDLERKGLKCFMADRDIPVANEWQDTIRSALLAAKRILILITPRSINRPWILLETGAAWALGKPLIPVLQHVSIPDLPDPIRRYEVRVIETTAQRRALVKELSA